MATTKEKDTCDLLDDDQRAVKKLFKEYDDLTGSHSKAAASCKHEIARDG